MTFSKILWSLAAILSLSACDGRRGQDNRLTFRVEYVSISDWGRKATSSLGVDQMMNFTFNACLTDNVSTDALKTMRFSISDGRTEKTAITDNRGCLQWTETHGIKTTEKSKHLIQYTRTIRGLEAFTGTVSVPLLLDLWSTPVSLADLHKDNAYTSDQLENLPIEKRQDFYFDTDLSSKEQAGGGPATYIEIPGEDDIDLNDNRAEILISRMTLKYAGLDKDQTQIDSLLTLKTVQKYEIRLEPKYLIHSVDQAPAVLPIVSGQMSVQILLLDDRDSLDIDAGDLVAHYSGTLDVTDEGVITGEIPLRIDDTAAIMSRTRIVLVLRPLGDAAADFRIGGYWGHFIPQKLAESSVTLASLGKNRVPFLPKLRKALRDIDIPVKALDLLMKEKNFVADSSGQAVDFRSNWNDRAQDALRPKYCDLLYDKGVTKKVWTGGIFGVFQHQEDRAVIDLCRENPKDYVLLSRYDFVDQVIGDPRYVSGTTPDQIKISRSLSFLQAKTNTWGVSDKVNLNGNVGIGLDDGHMAGPFSFGVKLGYNHDWYYSTKTEKTENNSVSATVSDDETLQVVSDTYDIDVQARPCLLVTGQAMASKTIYSCGGAGPRQTVRETYYAVRHKVDSSAFTDDDDPSGTQLRLLIRGESEYKQFQSLMVDGNVTLNLKSLSPTVDMSSALLPAFHTTQTYPGAISSPQ